LKPPLCNTYGRSAAPGIRRRSASVAEATAELLEQMETKAPPKNREVEAAKAKARSAKRFANQR